MSKAIAVREGHTKKNKISSNTETKIELAYTATDNGKTLYYVFNYSSNNGFAIIGGDEAARDVLGYCDSGSFNIDSIPDGLKFMLSCYSQNISSAIDKEEMSGLRAQRRIKKAPLTSRFSVEEMVTTRWDQDAPYNCKIPKSGEEFAGSNALATGCAATAAAQIMYYYKYPSRGIGQKSYEKAWAYDDGTTMAYTYQADFENTIYDWDNMLESYSGPYTKEQADAVGTLMYHIGVAMSSNYGQISKGGTSVITMLVCPMLKAYFRYDDKATMKHRSSYSDGEWEELIYNEIIDGRPVFYSGQSETMGHAFVCDGYDATNGCFHFNWGWSGSCNGYYPLTGSHALEPNGNGIGGGGTGSAFTQSQSVMIGFCPPEGIVSVQEVSLSSRNLELKTNDVHSLSATVLPENATYKNVTWLSSNPDVALVSNTGYIVAKATGKATITATATDGSNLCGTCEVTVTDEVNPDNTNIVIETGKCGIGVTYSIFKDNTMIISGKGAMTDYSIYSQIPWYEKYRTFITDLTIEEGVTTIGSTAFYGCSALKSIKAPHSLQAIGNYTFCNCTGLTAIEFTDSLTSIGEYAFSGCSSLESITILDRVSNVGKNAFEYCNSLKSISISPANTHYDSRNECNAIIETETNTLIVGCHATVIPNTVQVLANYAFNGLDSLYTIEIPASVDSISQLAFVKCSNVDSIIVAEDNPHFDSRDNCNAIIHTESNALIAGCKNSFIPNSVVEIKNRAFNCCTGLTSIEIPDNVEMIGSRAFILCENLKQVTLPRTLNSIESYVFYGCKSLESIYIPGFTTTIKSSAFFGCDSLANVYNCSLLPQSLGSSTFSNFTNLHVPRGYKDAYANAEHWNKFTILEDVVPEAFVISDEMKTFDNSYNYRFQEIDFLRSYGHTNWQALYVPFIMTYNDWKDQFDIARISAFYEFDTNKDGTADQHVLEIIPLNDENCKLRPNYPYLIKAKESGDTNIKLDDAILFKTEENSIECSTTELKFTIKGTYHAVDSLYSAGYYCMNNGELIAVTTDNAYLGAFRWYMSVESKLGSVIKPSEIKIRVAGEQEDDTTPINSIKFDTESSYIYSIDGRLVSNEGTQDLKSGMYIIDGKKVFINKMR